MVKYWNSIDNTPLEVFRLVSDTGDLNHLLIDGEFNDAEADKAWMQLYDEYNLAVKSKTNNVVFGLQKQAYILTGKYQLIHNCLFAIQELHNCNLINMAEVHDLMYFVKTINENGYQFDVTKGIGNEIARVSKQTKNLRTQLESINKKIESYHTDKKTKFIDTIASVEASMGFQINEQNTTVAKFVSYLNQMIEKNGKSNKDKRNNRRG